MTGVLDGVFADSPDLKIEKRDAMMRYAPAFVRLHGFDAKPLVECMGCKWPVFEDEHNPLDGPLASASCNRPAGWKGDRKLPYCDTHMKIAYR